MSQQLTAFRVMSDEFFQNSFFESKIVISTLQFRDMHKSIIIHIQNTLVIQIQQVISKLLF